MLKLCSPSWMEVGVTGHNFESWPPKDHSSHVCFKLTYWFQRRRLLNIFSIGSYVKIKSSHGAHLESPIGKRFTSLVHDHPMIIPAKSQFNWISGFWQESLEYRYISKLPMKNERIWSYVKETTSHLQNKLTKNIHLEVTSTRHPLFVKV